MIRAVHLYQIIISCVLRILKPTKVHLASTAASGGDDGSQLFILTRIGGGKPRWKVFEFSIESINAELQIQDQGAIQVVKDY